MKLRLHLARLRLLKWGITAPPLREGKYDTEIEGVPINLSHSGFNTKWLKQLNIEPKVILELGSFDDGDALRFVRAFPNANLVTVEADPDRIGVVRKNLAHTHAEVVHNAVGKIDGPVSWFVSKVLGKVDGQGSLYQHSDEFKEKFPSVMQSEEFVTVNGVSFENLCKVNGISTIDFMHMDIEGAEYDVLCSIGSHRPKLIFMEMLPNYFDNVQGIDGFEKLLKDLNYALVAWLSQDRLYLHQP